MNQCYPSSFRLSDKRIPENGPLISFSAASPPEGSAGKNFSLWLAQVQRLVISAPVAHPGITDNIQYSI